MSAALLPEPLPRLPVDRTPADPCEADKKTQDSWVKRNPNLIRLTGKHPFNAEAPLPDLFEAGFLTPAHLHFVRNHGAVPQVDVETLANWTIRVHGLVESERVFSLKDLHESFEVVTLPVTLVCAGNRRKEQNVVRKSLGFDWGSAGVSTALWTGVYLADILDAVNPIRRRAKHVIFEGADKLPNGPYGTSQKLSWAKSKDKGMMIAWAMNGAPLEPDHGFPVRLVVPGQIGGRSVKWLTRIEVSDRESQHHLHFHDNKVLPMQLSPERAREESSWWYDPSYLITELNVNSAITKPAHDESIVIPPDLSEMSKDTYTMRGYAYAGGGRRINRVEISIDDGRSWFLANVEYPEDLYRSTSHTSKTYGMLDLSERDTYFCWCFWSYEVPLAELASASWIYVRAMDESMNTQPRDMYVNATSMLNNWWFRVAIYKTDTGVRFVHPAPVGNTSPGWMEILKSSGADILRPVSGEQQSQVHVPTQDPEPAAKVELTNPAIRRRITASELKSESRNRAWFAVHGEVYDATDYLDKHPGGPGSILLVAGDDATEDFMAIHSLDAKRKLAQYHIGTLEDSEKATDVVTASSPDAVFLEPKTWKPVTLTDIEQINHDSYLYRFSLGSDQQPLGLPTGYHVYVRLKRKDTGVLVQRAYTPVSRHDAVGCIEFLVKIYHPSPQFPAGGKMTMGFHQLSLGDNVELKGPIGEFMYQGKGSVSVHGVPRKVTELGLICGGSGITPILQVLRAVLQDPSDETRLWLLNANRTEADILCKAELDKLHALHDAGRLHLHYTLTSAPGDWKHSTGRLTDTMLVTHLPQPSPDALILVCGPNAMIDEAIKPGLERCGWDIDMSLVVF